MKKKLKSHLLLILGHEIPLYGLIIPAKGSTGGSDSGSRGTHGNILVLTEENADGPNPNGLGIIGYGSTL